MNNHAESDRLHKQEYIEYKLKTDSTLCKMQKEITWLQAEKDVNK